MPGKDGDSAIYHKDVDHHSTMPTRRTKNGLQTLGMDICCFGAFIMGDNVNGKRRVCVPKCIFSTTTKWGGTGKTFYKIDFSLAAGCC